MIVQECVRRLLLAQIDIRLPRKSRPARDSCSRELDLALGYVKPREVCSKKVNFPKKTSPKNNGKAASRVSWLISLATRLYVDNARNQQNKNLSWPAAFSSALFCQVDERANSRADASAAAISLGKQPSKILKISAAAREWERGARKILSSLVFLFSLGTCASATIRRFSLCCYSFLSTESWVQGSMSY